LVGEVSDECHKTEDGDPEGANRSTDQRSEEQAIVSSANTVVEPLAVMIEDCYTFVTGAAVLRSFHSTYKQHRHLLN